MIGYRNKGQGKKKDINDRVVILLAILSILFSIVEIIVVRVDIVSSPVKIGPKAADHAEVKLCMNIPPVMNFTCNETAYQDHNYYCKVNYTDPNGPLDEFSSTFLNSNKSLFNITKDGVINFTPGKEDIGNYTILITLTDNSGCSNSYTSHLFYLNVINLNDPPYLVKDLPSFSMMDGSVIVPFYLLDYFDDPDIPYGDHLSFLYSKNNESRLSVTIDSSSRVTVKANGCPFNATLIFTAVDDYNASANSNVVNVRVYCQEGGETGGGGGAGGGGGGYGIQRICKPKWECGMWHPCQPNGKQFRRCVDKNACDPDNYIQYLWRNCTYYAQCYNGIKDENEEGIDCGGPCPPCGNCFDGIQNCHDGACEEGIDCGGPCNISCGNCSDMIKNCHDGACEEDIDCGGPCPPCGNCFDGIQNCHDGACEEGIDCGGPCKPCFHIEKPFLKKRNIWINILAFLIAFFSIGALIYAYFKPQIDRALDYLLRPIKKRRRKAVILPLRIAKKYLEDIEDLEKKIREDYEAHLHRGDVKSIKNLIMNYEEFFLLRRSIIESILKREFSGDIKRYLRRKILPSPLKKWLIKIGEDMNFGEKNITKYIFSLITEEAKQEIENLFNKKEYNKEKVNLAIKYLYLRLYTLLEEMRTLIAYTSNVSELDLKHNVYKIDLGYGKKMERKINKYNFIKELKELLSYRERNKEEDLLFEMFSLENMIRNIFLGMQTHLKERIIDNYISLLNTYDSLSVTIKDLYYSLIDRLRDALMYYSIIPEEQHPSFLSRKNVKTKKNKTG